MFACAASHAQRADPRHDTWDTGSDPWNAGTTPQQQATSIMRAWNQGLQNYQDGVRRSQQEDERFLQNLYNDRERSILRLQPVIPIAPFPSNEKNDPTRNIASDQKPRELDRDSNNQRRESEAKKVEAARMAEIREIESRKAESKEIFSEILAFSGVEGGVSIPERSELSTFLKQAGEAGAFVGGEIKDFVVEKAIDGFVTEFLEPSLAKIITVPLPTVFTAASLLDSTELADGTLPEAYAVGRMPPGQRRLWKSLGNKFSPSDPLQIMNRAKKDAEQKFIGEPRLPDFNFQLKMVPSNPKP
jgi:hypothetical protein